MTTSPCTRHASTVDQEFRDAEFESFLEGFLGEMGKHPPQRGMLSDGEIAHLAARVGLFDGRATPVRTGNLTDCAWPPQCAADFVERISLL